MDRAERRRVERASGFRRARGKKGRRPRFRRQTGEPEADRLMGLRAAGFQIAAPRLLLPTDVAAAEVERLRRRRA